MIMEKKYHTLAQQDMAEMEKRLEEKRNTMTEDERIAEEREQSQNLRKLCARLEWQKEHFAKQMNVRKQELFQILQERAMWLAKYIEADIVIDTDDQILGKIELTTENILFNYSTDKTAREIFSELILAADEVEIGVAEGHCVLRFLFEFVEEVEIK